MNINLTNFILVGSFFFHALGSFGAIIPEVLIQQEKDTALTSLSANQDLTRKFGNYLSSFSKEYVNLLQGFQQLGNDKKMQVLTVSGNLNSLISVLQKRYGEKLNNIAKRVDELQVYTAEFSEKDAFDAVMQQNPTSNGIFEKAKQAVERNEKDLSLIDEDLKNIVERLEEMKKQGEFYPIAKTVANKVEEIVKALAQDYKNLLSAEMLYLKNAIVWAQWRTNILRIIVD